MCSEKLSIESTTVANKAGAVQRPERRDKEAVSDAKADIRPSSLEKVYTPWPPELASGNISFFSLF